LADGTTDAVQGADTAFEDNMVRGDSTYPQGRETGFLCPCTITETIRIKVNLNISYVLPAKGGLKMKATPVNLAINFSTQDSFSKSEENNHRIVDAYFSADVETDGPIPGPYSILSFAMVYAGTFDGIRFNRPKSYTDHFYSELRPISSEFQDEALKVNGLDREKLIISGTRPEAAMEAAYTWIKETAGVGTPVLVAFPLSFDWTWLYWYFTRFASKGSPFGHSRCFDIKTALAVKSKVPISWAARSRLPSDLAPIHKNTHHALDDAIAQAEIFANVFEWDGR
jgi:hypothetical protein